MRAPAPHVLQSTLRSRLLHDRGGPAGGEEDDGEGPLVEGLVTVEEDEDEGEDELRAHFPASFGARSQLGPTQGRRSQGGSSAGGRTQDCCPACRRSEGVRS